MATTTLQLSAAPANPDAWQAAFVLYQMAQADVDQLGDDHDDREGDGRRR